MERIADLTPPSNLVSLKTGSGLLDSDNADGVFNFTALECEALIEDEVSTSEAVQAPFWREELVEKYCDAIVMGDLNVISAVLQEASKDEFLDRMIDEANGQLKDWEFVLL